MNAKDILISVFSHLDRYDILRCRLTCKLWHNVCDISIVFRNMIHFENSRTPQNPQNFQSLQNSEIWTNSFMENYKLALQKKHFYYLNEILIQFNNDSVVHVDAFHGLVDRLRRLSVEPLSNDELDGIDIIFVCAILIKDGHVQDRMNTLLDYVNYVNYNYAHIWDIIYGYVMEGAYYDFAKFLNRHKDRIDWDRISLYRKGLTEEDLLKYPKIVEKVQWHHVLGNIKLSISTLTGVLEKYHHVVNMTAPVINQILNEDLIEKYYENMYNNTTNWDMIFKHQRHLSPEFLSKYESRKSRSILYP